MYADSMQDKTAVFSIGSLSREEEPRTYDLDEPTRELPLIAGRFAGREWAPEDLRREFRETDTLSGRELRRRRTATLLIGAVCAILLLVVSMLGQAQLTERSIAMAPAEENKIVFYREENVRPVMTKSTQAQRDTSSYNDERVQLLRQVQEGIPDHASEDRITVMNVRRGRELHRFWQSISDALGGSFR